MSLYWPLMGRARERKRAARAAASTASPKTPRSRWAATLAVVILAILPYLNTLRNGFALDDIDIVQQNQLIRDLGNVGRVFSTDYWGGAVAPGAWHDPGLYRPLTVTTFALDYSVWNGNPAGYHATNVAVHAGATFVVFRAASALVASPMAALAAAAVFAVHPIHTDAVDGIVGRAELLATLFFMLALTVSIPRPDADGETALPGPSRAAAAAVLYLLALFSKESAATFPVVLLLLDWLYRNDWFVDRARAVRALAFRYGFLAVAALVYLAARQNAVKAGANMWLGFVGVTAQQRFLTAVRVASEYLGMFVFPRTLLAEYWKTDVPIAHSVLEPLVLLAFVVLLAIIVAVIWFRRERLLVFGFGFFAITLLPMSNLLFPIGVGKAERILYLPSVGLCFVVAWAVAKAVQAKAPRWLVPVIAAPVLLAFSARTVRRNEDWRDQFTLAMATLRDSPGSPLMSDLAGLEFARRNDMNRALPLFLESARQAPDVGVYHVHLGAVYLQQGRLADAERELKRALQIQPNDPDAHNNLGAVYLDQQKYDAAIIELSAALRVNPWQVDAHNNLGVAYMNRGVIDSAAREFREALRLNPGHPNARQNLARLQAAGQRAK